MTNSVLLYNDDAYKRVNKLVSEGLIVNHIITDPPYNISKDNNLPLTYHS